MPIHDFTATPKVNSEGIRQEPAPALDINAFKPDIVKEVDKNLNSLINTAPDTVATVLPKGFEAFDAGIKLWLEGIKVPAGDTVKNVAVRVAGGDKTFLMWNQERRSNRIELPAIAISRTNVKRNEQKFSPPYYPMARNFTSKAGTHVRQTYRPWPALIDYQLSIWAEWKDDAEYISYQIITRMNPLAEIVIQDDRLIGTAQILFNGIANNSDIDVSADETAKVRYDIDITVEGWLPLAGERVTPTVLGRVMTANEFTGEFLEDLSSDKNTGAAYNGFDIGPETLR